MPQSRNRPKHYLHRQHHHPSSATHHPAKAKRSAAFTVAVIAALMGLAIIYFTIGGEVGWLIFGAAAGGVIGYLLGRGMDKSIEKNIAKK
jgi:hypothetical protein